MVKNVRRFGIVLVNLDPTIGAEIRKTRPCLVVSPDAINASHLRTVVIVPMTTVRRRYPSRVPIRFQGKDGEVALDQIRSIDRDRLVKRLGSARPDRAATLAEMFSLNGT